MSRALGFMMLCVWQIASASNLGNYGQVFAIKEVDIREVVMGRLSELKKAGQLEQLEAGIKDRVAKQVTRPTPSVVETLKKTQIHYVDPSVVIQKDIYSADGQLIAKKGTRVNPFTRINLSKVLVFINADDKNQVQYAKSLTSKYNNIKYVLTSGSIKEASRIFGRVYFDMHRGLTEKLNIFHVPAIAEQSGALWKITEVGLSDD